MLYEFLYPLRNEIEWMGFLNVLRYVPFRAMAALLTASLMYFALFPWFIRRLQTRSLGQQIREDGPRDHVAKKGTPTMGGSLILLSIAVPTVLWCNLSNMMVWMTLAVTVAMGLIGLADDILKIRKGTNKGLKGWQKFSAQTLVAAAAAYFLFFSDIMPADWAGISTNLSIPFVSTKKFFPHIDPYIYSALVVCVIVGTTNAVNLTDGLDGLAIGPVLVAASTYMVLAYFAGAVIFGIPLAKYLGLPQLESAGELPILTAAIIGAGIGFLWYNTFPAVIFMGDVGSLSLGGALAMFAIFTKHELLSVILCGVFVIETLSVITQVASFQLFKKRVFAMAPLHHHFELKGWAEPKIIVRFWIISIILALIALVSLKLR
ncbi:MAG: phospho-N-acetylmuramoyl-pentapeptide-transferase [Pseudomonadota bacterium]